MQPEAPTTQDREQLLDELVTTYLQAVAAGQATDRQAWLSRYPELATELAEFFAEQDDLHQLGRPLRQIAQAADLATPVPDESLLETPDSSAGEDAGGRPFGNYELLGRLGRGGMGVVYRARQKGLNRLVALKVVRTGELASAADVRRFRQEAETVALLDHPNIVPVYEVGEQDGRLFFSMKLIEGGSLAQQIEARSQGAGVSKETQRETARLLVTVARAVHHAHQRGVLHRDLKPSNILLDHAGQPHVTDFGLAKRVETDSDLTQSGALVGTPSYMAPEQAMGQKTAITTATDVYGLGAVLYTLLTGRPPFRGETVLKTLEQVQALEPTPPRQDNRSLDRDLETICLKCLQKAPAQRYASAEALANDLQHWLEDMPILARRPSLGLRLGRLWRRHKTLVGAGLAVTVALGTLLAILARTAYERAARRAALASEARTALQNSADWQQRDRLPEALAEARRANLLLAGTDADPVLVEQARERLADLKLVDWLEQIRLDVAAVVVGGRFERAMQEPRYQRAFLAAGLDAEVTPDATAARIRNSSVSVELADALDEWALARRAAAGQQDASWKKLLHVASLADPDPWRARMRAALASQDRKAIEVLLGSADVNRLTPQTLAAAASALRDDNPTDHRVEDTLLAAQRRYPDDFWINTELFYHYRRLAKWPQAMRFAAVAVAIRPRSAGARVNLGCGLSHQGQTGEALAEFHEALGLDPEYGTAHFNLGVTLAGEGRMDKAITEFRQAIQCDPANARYHNNLGSALASVHRQAEAIVEFHEALRLNPDAAEVHNNLGMTLADCGRADEAVTEFQAAIRLRKDWAAPHVQLGNLFFVRRQLAEAIQQYRAVVQLNQGNAQVYYNLGVALDNTGQRPEAKAQYAEAIRIQSDFPEAHCNLARILEQDGKFHQAVDEYRRGHEQGSRKSHWQYPSAQWLRDAETMARLDDHLDDFLAGRLKPADAGERLKLARLCAQPFKGRYAASARWYAEAFTAASSLAGDLNAQHRYNAACAAILAGCGKGKDAGKLRGAERGQLRQRARAWLKADVDAYREVLKKSAGKAGPAIARRLRHWLEDGDLAGVRNPDALAQLPAAERYEWQILWQEVETLRQRATNPRTAAEAARPGKRVGAEKKKGGR